MVASLLGITTMKCKILYKSKNRNYISEEKFKELYNESYQLMNQIIGFRNQLKD